MSETLFLAHRIPFPPDRGDKIRTFHELKHLAGLGRVHLACLADDEADVAALELVRVREREAAPVARDLGPDLVEGLADLGCEVLGHQ